MKKEAFQRVLRDNRNRVYGYAWYMLRNQADAEDATQEVFLRLWRHRETMDDERLGGWLTRVAHNLCIDVLRRRKTTGIGAGSASELELDALPAGPGQASDPAAQAELSESQRLLLEALESLPEKTRSMLLLHYFQGMKYARVGEILDTAEATVKVAVHRGKKRLRELLAPSFPERLTKVSNG